MKDKKENNVEWILRIGVFGVFLGHGVLAWGIKQSWIPYFTKIGFEASTATTLLPLIGLMDIAVALSVLLYPMRIVLMWATFWGFVTEVIRPITGEPIWDFVERAANWAAPLALLVMYGGIRNLFHVKTKSSYRKK